MKLLNKLLFVAFALIFLWPVSQAMSQDLPNEFLAAGCAYNRYAAPQINGLVTYANRVQQTNIFSFTTYDVRSASDLAYQPQTSIRTGVAPMLFRFGRVWLFGLGDAGVAYTGSAFGAAFSGGTGLAIQLGRGWSVLAVARVIKTGLTDRQEAYEIMIGWGK
jgi:hypothetical protein